SASRSGKRNAAIAQRHGSGASVQPFTSFSVHAPTSTAEEPRGAYTLPSHCRSCRVSVPRCPNGAALIIGGDFNFVSFGERLPAERIANTPAELTAPHGFRRQSELFVGWRDTRPGLPL